MRRNTILEALSDNIVIDKDKCTWCGLCVDRCILDNLRMALAPCSGACPMNVNAQGYVQLALRGRDDEARDMVRRDLPFPESIARVCHHPCEAACHRGKETGDAVGIKALKRYLFDNPQGQEPPLPDRAPDTGKRMAVVGSGPAGMTAAFELRRRGHCVTVYEAGPEPGGLMATAIPEFRLPLAVVRRETGMLARMGVEFQCNHAVGRDSTLDSLSKGHDGVVLAVGFGGHRRLGVAGEDLDGVHHGLPFLQAVKAGKGPELSGKVVVVGGGNAAVDAALTALRQGAGSVTVVSLERADQLPAYDAELAQARDEGVRFVCGWGVGRIREKDGRAGGLELQACTRLFDTDGRFAPVLDPSSAMDLDADAIVVAIGQQRDKAALAGSTLTLRDVENADPLTRRAGESNVFTAGDCRTGPGSAIQAMADGREAAESAHRLAMGEHLSFGRAYPGPVEECTDIDTSRGSDAPRFAPRLRKGVGKGDYAEAEAAMDQATAQAEAGRCYSCGAPFGKYRTCWFCLPCEVSCPNDALWVEIPYLLR